ncbi:hypothetical protein K1719_023390 [Acacia pycnantha]|nr:hypothetical protein K1719_023390 [Acacia pycnantha]
MRRKHRRAWTVAEVMKSVEGVSRCGAGRWSEIKRLSFASYSYRTSVDLKASIATLYKFYVQLQQIRTREMHLQAEFGFAAHWRCKEEEGDCQHSSFVFQMVEWARYVVTWHCETMNKDSSSAQCADSLKPACKIPSKFFPHSPLKFIPNLALPSNSSPHDWPTESERALLATCPSSSLHRLHQSSSIITDAAKIHPQPRLSLKFIPQSPLHDWPTESERALLETENHAGNFITTCPSSSLHRLHQSSSIITDAAINEKEFLISNMLLDSPFSDLVLIMGFKVEPLKQACT